jgi:hypothetical protein
MWMLVVRELFLKGYGSRASGAPPPLLSRYGSPRLTGVSLLRGSNAEVLDCSRVDSSGRPLTGGSAVLVVDGANFGDGSATTVFVRNVPCVALAGQSSHSRILCRTPLCSGGRCPEPSMRVGTPVCWLRALVGTELCWLCMCCGCICSGGIGLVVLSLCICSSAWPPPPPFLC